MKNHIQLIGNLGMNPEITNFESGEKKVRFTLATNETFTSKAGVKKKRTFWHNMYAWGPTALYIAKAGKKGTRIAITGKLVTQRYRNKEGNFTSMTAVEVSRAIVL